jgi:hypothetical protein
MPNEPPIPPPGILPLSEETQYPRPPFIMGSFTSLLDDNGSPVNPRHVTRRADEPGRKQRYIAHSTAEVKHSHPRLKSSRQEELPGPHFKESSLQFQALTIMEVTFETSRWPSSFGIDHPGIKSVDTDIARAQFLGQRDGESVG